MIAVATSIAPWIIGPGEHRDPDAQSVDAFTLDVRSIVRINRCVDHHNLKVGLAQSRSESEQAKRSAERWSVVRRVEENDLSPGQHVASTAFGSSRFASTAGFSAAVRSFSFLFSQSSTGKR